jgi:hypothetical protein
MLFSSKTDGWRVAAASAARAAGGAKRQDAGLTGQQTIDRRRQIGEAFRDRLDVRERDPRAGVLGGIGRTEQFPDRYGERAGQLKKFFRTRLGLAELDSAQVLRVHPCLFGELVLGQVQIEPQSTHLLPDLANHAGTGLLRN